MDLTHLQLDSRGPRPLLDDLGCAGQELLNEQAIAPTNGTRAEQVPSYGWCQTHFGRWPDGGSSSKIRWLAPSRSSYWPERRLHRKASSAPIPIGRALGTRNRRLVIVPPQCAGPRGTMKLCPPAAAASHCRRRPA